MCKHTHTLSLPFKTQECKCIQSPSPKKFNIINSGSKTIINYTTDQSELMALFLGQQLSDPSLLHGLLHRIFCDLVNQKDRLLLYVALYIMQR